MSLLRTGSDRPILASPHPRGVVGIPTATPSALSSWVGLGIVLLSLVGCNQSAEKGGGAATKEPPKPIVAKTIAVQEATWPVVVRTQGSLVANEVAAIGSKVAGRVVEVNVDVGKEVEMDAPMIKLDSREYVLLAQQAQAQLLQARSAVGLKPEDPVESLNPENSPPVREARAVWNEAKQSVERLTALEVVDATSANELETARALEKVAEARYSSALNATREKIAFIHVQTAELELAKQRVADTTIQAPFPGIVRERNVAVGTYVQAGETLATLVSVAKLRFRGTVPERYAPRLSIGQTVYLTLDFSPNSAVRSPGDIASQKPNSRLEVKVTRISPVIDLQTRSLAFEAEVDNSEKRLQSGLFAQAEVVIDQQATAIVVPTQSVIRFAGVDKVWKVVDGQVKDQVVRLGRQDSDRVEVLEGLVSGDQILEKATEGRAAPLATST